MEKSEVQMREQANTVDELMMICNNDEKELKRLGLMEQVNALTSSHMNSHFRGPFVDFVAIMYEENSAEE